MTVRWMGAAAAVVAATVVVGVGAAVVGGSTQEPAAVSGEQPGVGLVSWLPRGSLISSTGLLERAVAVWRQLPDQGAQPGEEPRVLYADRSAPGVVNHLSVVLAAGTRVAWVSTPTTTGAPALEDPLAVRAVTTVTADAWAVGFVAVAPLAQDAPIRVGGAVSLVLAAPGSRSRLVSSAQDMGLVETDTDADAGDEVSTRVVAVGVAAWNSTVHSRHAAATHVDPVGAGVRDPATPAVTVIGTDMGGTQVSDSAAPGDWVITRTGWLGVVGEGRRVDTTLVGLPSALRLQLAITGEAVTVDGAGRLAGVPSTANPGNRVMLADSGGARISLGHLSGSSASGWQLVRAVPEATTGPALLWTGHR